ncbi:MAG: hypothetical protein SGJ27_24950 [Candidatus Melainabacteria bacterium]|nr:hypothetical protein [Candidatus Melainabacteria bacterium]
MNQRSAAIIIDTGFSVESIQAAQNIIAIIDVRTGSITPGYPYLSWECNEELLGAFAGDPFNHGSMVLSALMREAPDLPVVLIRAFDDARLLRTSFHKGRISKPGWTEAYLTAVQLCKNLGLCSVANMSFGGYTHAADGSGWEAHCLSQVTGPGKPGHVVIAGAGTGTGDAIHSSWRTEPGQVTEVFAQQNASTTYNFWSSAEPGSLQYNNWLMEVFINDYKISEEFSADLIPNLWNDRKQVTFHVEGEGVVKIRTSRFWGADTRYRDLCQFSSGLIAANAQNVDKEHASRLHCAKKPPLVAKRKNDVLRFDCWINRIYCNSYFLDHYDQMTIAEPAIFPNVISVGLDGGNYSADQLEIGGKPDLLIDGDGPVSFRLPEITAEVAAYLSEDPTLDVVAVNNLVRNEKAA